MLAAKSQTSLDFARLHITFRPWRGITFCNELASRIVILNTAPPDFAGEPDFPGSGSCDLLKQKRVPNFFGTRLRCVRVSSRSIPIGVFTLNYASEVVRRRISSFLF